MVKPGGLLVIDHYEYTIWYYLKMTPLYRAILKRLPPKGSKAIVDFATDVSFPIHWAFRRSHLAQRILSRVSPCLFYCHLLGGSKPSPSGDGFSVLRQPPGPALGAWNGRSRGQVVLVGLGRPVEWLR